MNQEPWIDKETLTLFFECRPAFKDRGALTDFMAVACDWVEERLCPTEPDRELKSKITRAHCVFLPHRQLTAAEIKRALEIVIAYNMFAVAVAEARPPPHEADPMYEASARKPPRVKLLTGARQD